MAWLGSKGQNKVITKKIYIILKLFLIMIKKEEAKINRFERKYLPEFVYGGIDGSITTFAVVAGSAGAALSPGILLIFGFANIFADGFSLAVSNYLSVKSQYELMHGKGSGIIKSEAKHPLKAGFATFFSFMLIGLIPLLSFIFAYLSPLLIGYELLVSSILTAIALLVVGWIKGEVVKKHPVRAALETLIIGGIAAILAFIVGYYLRGLI